MSILADKFIKEGMQNQVKRNDKWYVAKWISYITLEWKIKDCIKILRNKAIAVHFKEDEERNK